MVLAARHEGLVDVRRTLDGEGGDAGR